MFFYDRWQRTKGRVIFEMEAVVKQKTIKIALNKSAISIPITERLLAFEVSLSAKQDQARVVQTMDSAIR